MGQGYSLTTLSAGSAGIDVPELSDLDYEKSLGDARFMKSIRARHRDGVVVAKVVMKPYPSMKLGSYIKQITRERNILADVPNAFGYHRAFETSSNGFLVRQYIFSSLYDRMSTRPFLDDIEKRWLAFQLLCAVRDCHSRNVYHGDIKTENTLVTSWNWLYLTDFSSSFKPTFLPEDNPADFSFFFDISGRRTCYLAPERFLTSGEKADGRGGVTWAMDIFSAGCVIAELFLEYPIFNLSQLFKYRRNEYNPTEAQLSRIEDRDVRELVAHMIRVEPESRYSADEYLNFWRRKAFPEYFYSFLHQYMHLITDPTSGRSAITTGTANLGESDGRIDRVYYDFDKTSYLLGYSNNEVEPLPSVEVQHSNDMLFPLHLDILNHRKVLSAKTVPTIDDGTLLFLNLVTSSLRSTARATARIRACDLLLAFAERLTDDSKLDRVLPFVMHLLHDRSDIVKIAALRTLTQLVVLVTTVLPVNAYIFPEYIMPRLEMLFSAPGVKQNPLVRSTYASCLATLAYTASRFLDVVQALKAEGSLSTVDTDADSATLHHAYRNSYDAARADLVRFFETQTKTLLTDSNSDVRRAFLGSVSSLCVFFGSAKAADVILSHLNTYLNDKDWRLKSAFFDVIVGVATYVGSANLEEYTLPLMIQALSDPEEYVVRRVLRSFAVMAELGLFQRSTIWELINAVSAFTMHPNIWIREAAAHFLSSSTKYLSIAERECIVKPRLASFFRVEPTVVSEVNLLDALKKPLPRPVFDLAVTWITKVDKGIFWIPVQQRIASYATLQRIPMDHQQDFNPSTLAKITRNEEDNQWITRLRNAGMTPDDEFKLLVLRLHMYRLAKRKPKEESYPDVTRLNHIITLKDLGITPSTIFFDHHRQILDDALTPNQYVHEIEEQPRTIADALLDASMTIDDMADNLDTVFFNNSKTTQLAHVSNSESLAVRNVSRQTSTPLSTSPGTPTRSKKPSESGRGAKEHTVKAASSEEHEGAPISVTSSSNSMDVPELPKHLRDVGRKVSAIDLIQRKNVPRKAVAETSTSSASALGTVKATTTSQTTPLAVAQEQKQLQAAHVNFQAAHSYRGQDPSIIKFLDSYCLENQPADVLEFGPWIKPVKQRQGSKGPNASTENFWRPDGTLVAMFGEHTAAVTRVVVSPDHLFFMTGSDDGSIKIWDTARLERNVAHRSRQTYKHASGTKVTSLCVITNTHCFVSTASDGSVHVVKVDCIEASSGNAKYGKLRCLREWRVPFPSSHIVWSSHFEAEAQSILLLATNTSQVYAIELRTMSLLYTLDNPVSHGTLTCFCVDRQRNWLLLGTTHGILDMWDLRFRLRVKSWALPGSTEIHRVVLHPVGGIHEKDVVVAGGSVHADVTVWDVDKVICKEVYRMAQSPKTTTSPSLKDYTPWFPDTLSADAMLARFVTSPPLSVDESTSNRGVRALCMGVQPAEDDSRARHGLFVSAGPDRKVRLWNMGNDVGASCVVNGLEADEKQPKFAMTEQLGADCVLYEEQVPPREDDNATSNNAASEAKGKGKANVGAKRTAGTASKAPKSTVVSLQQQQLLKTHLDSVLDVALLEHPCHMVVSVDRSGVVMVTQ